MQIINSWASALWENHISQWEIPGRISDIRARIFVAYANSIRAFMDWTTEHKFRPLGLIFGTLFLEIAPSVKTAARRLLYSADPKTYGFNQFEQSHAKKRPVLLIHGRMGAWSDLAELASSLRTIGMPVFVISLNHSTPTEEDRRRIREFILDIRNQYRAKFPEGELPVVDIVGHSLGGDMALYTSFTPNCSYIEEKDEATMGNLKMIKGSKVRSDATIGKVITIGMPSNSSELEWASLAGKSQDLFNIIGLFDVVMGHKECALEKHASWHKQCKKFEYGHLGLLNPETYQQVAEWLLP